MGIICELIMNIKTPKFTPEITNSVWVIIVNYRAIMIK